MRGSAPGAGLAHNQRQAGSTPAPATIARYGLCHAAAVGAVAGVFGSWWWPWVVWLYERARP